MYVLVAAVTFGAFMAFQKRNDLPSHLKKQARGVFLKLVVQGLITEAVGLLLYEQRGVVACMAKLTVLGSASDVSYLDSSLAQSLHSGAPCWAGPHPKWRYRDLTSIPHCLSLHSMTRLVACSFLFGHTGPRLGVGPVPRHFNRHPIRWVHMASIAITRKTTHRVLSCVTGTGIGVALSGR